MQLFILLFKIKLVIVRFEVPKEAKQFCCISYVSYLYLHAVVRNVGSQRFTRSAHSPVSLKQFPAVTRGLETPEAELEDFFEDTGNSQVSAFVPVP